MASHHGMRGWSLSNPQNHHRFCLPRPFPLVPAPIHIIHHHLGIGHRGKQNASQHGGTSPRSSLGLSGAITIQSAIPPSHQLHGRICPYFRPRRCGAGNRPIYGRHHSSSSSHGIPRILRSFLGYPREFAESSGIRVSWRHVPVDWRHDRNSLQLFPPTFSLFLRSFVFLSRTLFPLRKHNSFLVDGQNRADLGQRENDGGILGGSVETAGSRLSVARYGVSRRSPRFFRFPPSGQYGNRQNCCHRRREEMSGF